MAKQRYINTKFWDDEYVIRLDPIEKLLFLYLLTNPLTNIAGIYEISLRRIAFDTGVDETAIKNIFKRFAKEKRIYYLPSCGWVVIANFPKHQDWQKKPKIRTGIEIILSQVPHTVLKSIDTLSIPYTYPSNYSNSNSNSNSNNNTNTPSFNKKKKPTYNGMEMRKKGNKWYCIPKDGGSWLLFAGKEKDIIWK